MYEVWDWVNTYLNEDQRKRVYEYAFIKTRKGIYLEQYLQKIGISRRTFDRRIEADCQRIADALNQKRRVRLTVAFDDVTQIARRTHVNYGSFEELRDGLARRRSDRPERAGKG